MLLIDRLDVLCEVQEIPVALVFKSESAQVPDKLPCEGWVDSSPHASKASIPSRGPRIKLTP